MGDPLAGDMETSGAGRAVYVCVGGGRGRVGRVDSDKGAL